MREKEIEKKTCGRSQKEWRYLSEVCISWIFRNAGQNYSSSERQDRFCRTESSGAETEAFTGRKAQNFDGTWIPSICH